jgi:hypothetical protein
MGSQFANSRRFHCDSILRHSSALVKGVLGLLCLEESSGGWGFGD